MCLSTASTCSKPVLRVVKKTLQDFSNITNSSVTLASDISAQAQNTSKEDIPSNIIIGASQQATSDDLLTINPNFQHRHSQEIAHETDWTTEHDLGLGDKSDGTPNLTRGGRMIKPTQKFQVCPLSKSREKTVKKVNGDPELILRRIDHWVAMGDGELDIPQYITDNSEAGVFVWMRRAIEEVDLYVSIVRFSHGWKEVPPRKQLDANDGEKREDGGDNCMEEEEWHTFAMSETPLTVPPTQKNGGGKDQLAGPETALTEKGKNKRPAEKDTDTDADSDDAMIVPVLRSTVQETAYRSRPVARRLIFGIPGISDMADGDGGSSSSSDSTEELPIDEGQHWGKFDEVLHQMLNHPYTPALFGKNAPRCSMIAGEQVNKLCVDTALKDIQYESDEIYVGRIFKSKTDCKIKLAIHAMNRKFHFRTPRSSPAMLLAQCVGNGCPWRVYTVLVDASGNFQVRQANLLHSCTVDERCNYHKLATTQVIGEILQSRFVGIKQGPTAAAIRKDEFHVNVSYWKAWRAREFAMGTMVGSYSLIPPYLALLQSSNEGTTCFLESTDVEDGGTRFKYCFVAYGASISGYAAMRKLVVVDGTSLKGKFGGCLLSASATRRKFSSISACLCNYRHASIYTGLRKVSHHAHHVACVVHLWRNIKAIFKRTRLPNLMSAAAKAFTLTEFNKKFIEIQKFSPACAAYLVDLGFDKWTRAHFKGQRYNIMESNIAELWNGVIKEAREYPLITMFEYVHTTVMGWLALRRAQANREKGTLTPNVRKIVEENYEFLPVWPCMEYDEIGIPCIHALAAATRIGFPSDALVAPAYYVTTWRARFTGKIYPVPSVGGLEIGAGTSHDQLPPPVRHPPSRPRKVRILSRGEYKKAGNSSSRKRKRCGQSGHNKASCCNPI
ncbi:hypothetical protein Bca4012_026863 [Brassica carinata]